MSKPTRSNPSPLPPGARKARRFLYCLIAGVVLFNFIIWRLASNADKPAGADAASTNPAAPFKLVPDKTAFAAYAGSASCRDCHPQAYSAWTNSNHALAERSLNVVQDQSGFAPARTIPHGTQSTEVRLAKGRFEIETAGADGRKQAFPIDRVIGVSPLRQFLVPAERGRYQITEVAMDPRNGEWFDIFGQEDRRPGEWGHWTGRGMTWNVMCAGCHNTRIRKHYDPASDRYDTTMVEMGVGCEACHGPMADHVAWQRKNPQDREWQRKNKDPHLTRFTTNQWLDVCGACHSRRAELTGDFVPGRRYSDHFALTIPDETDIYYPDGQVRDEDYEYASFLGSRMRAAGVRCWDCHEIHSAKVPTTQNLLCMRCHNGQQTNAPVINPTQHSFHKPQTSGEGCVDCHMPLTPYMQRHERRDHGFTIPDPLLTRQHGIPNACNRCHKDKTTDWSIEYVEKWYGKRMDRHTRRRAQVLALARAGSSAVLTNLVSLAQTEPIPVWRASALTLLRPWAEHPAVLPTLLERAADPDPIVRAAAARGLEGPAAARSAQATAVLEILLNDPARQVRVDAAWALRAQVDTNAPAVQDLLHYLTFNADMPSAMLQQGVFFMDRGAIDAALAQFRRAVAMDPGSAPLHHALAVALSAQGKTGDAVQCLETACRLAPRDPEMRFKLGLAYNEAGRPTDALTALEMAVKLDPQYSQAWYNLGLALSARNEHQRAIEALERAEALNPASPQIPYARATLLYRMGRALEARNAVRRALEVQPAYPEALVLLQTLEGEQ